MKVSDAQQAVHRHDGVEGATPSCPAELPEKSGGDRCWYPVRRRWSVTYAVFRRSGKPSPDAPRYQELEDCEANRILTSFEIGVYKLLATVICEMTSEHEDCEASGNRTLLLE